MTEPIFLDVQNIQKTYITYKQSPTFLGGVKNFFFRKQLHVKALHPLSFTVKRGEFIGVLGPNGSGKTTTLKILTGLITSTQGKAIAFQQYDTSKRHHAYLKQIGMVMGQRQQLLPDLPALDSFYLAKALYDISDIDFKERLAHFLSLLQIEDKVSVPVRKLSLGERMKLELILALLHYPHILFLDEPTIGLDFQAAKIIRKFLWRMNQEFKMTILLTSHYHKDIEELCQRVILLNHGKLLFDGPLSGVDERIQGQRVIELFFKTKKSVQDFEQQYLQALKNEGLSFSLGECEEENAIKFIVSIKESQGLLSFILQVLPKEALLDLKVSEQPLDEVFSQLYSQNV